MANFSSAFDRANYFALRSGYNTNGNVQPEILIGTIIQGVLQFLGVIFLGFVIYGGITWMTASGSEDKVKSAKKIITNSVIGLIIVVLAYAISAFIVQNVLKNKISNI